MASKRSKPKPLFSRSTREKTSLWVKAHRRALIMAAVVALIGGIFIWRSFAATTSADLNGDGKVTIQDLALLLINFGKTGTASKGDINGDGKVTIQDLALLLVAFGKPIGGGGGGAAPGFSKGLDMDDGSGISQDAADAQSIGVTYARVGLDCGDTSQYTNMADTLKQHGINFIANYSFSSSGCNAGISLADFTAKTKEDVNTLLPHGVHVWEIGNEENSGWNGESDFCGVNGSGDRACAQRTFEPYLEAAYKTIHSMDPQAVVLYGGIDYDQGNVKAYLQAMLDNNTNPWNFMDGMAYHPYGDSLAQNEQAMNDLKSYMEQNATWASRPIWITEVGCWASGFTDQNSPCETQTEEGKAQQLTGFLDFLKNWNKGTTFEYRAPFCWYILHEQGGGTGYGLESDSGGQHFPAFDAYKGFQLK